MNAFRKSMLYILTLVAAPLVSKYWLSNKNPTNLNTLRGNLVRERGRGFEKINNFLGGDNFSSEGTLPKNSYKHSQDHPEDPYMLFG